MLAVTVLSATILRKLHFGKGVISEGAQNRPKRASFATAREENEVFGEVQNVAAAARPKRRERPLKARIGRHG
jgi:hypothetical protein